MPTFGNTPLKSLEDLSRFLHHWYDEPEHGLNLPGWAAPVPVAPPLAYVFSHLGQLSSGADEWIRIGRESPLACQDGFWGPRFIRQADGRIDFASENQGNWSVGYRADDPAPDPPVWSNWIDLEESGAGHLPVGATLSEFLITLLLTETVFFGGEADPEIAAEKARSCDTVLWSGRYYNAEGFGGKYTDPSHTIRTSHPGDALALYWNGEFSGFAADRNAARRKWKDFKGRSRPA